MTWDSPVKNVDILFYQAVNHVRSIVKFLSAFSCLRFQCQFSFKVCSTTQICPACAQSRTWVMICLVVHFSKSLVCYLGSDTCMYYLGVSPEVYTWLHWITFLLSLHFIISSKFSDFLKAQGFSFLTLLHFPWYYTCFQCQVLKRLRNKRNVTKILPKASGPQFLCLEFQGYAQMLLPSSPLLPQVCIILVFKLPSSPDQEIIERKRLEIRCWFGSIMNSGFLPQSVCYHLLFFLKRRTLHIINH